MILIGTDSKVYKDYIRYCTCVLDTSTGKLEKYYTTSKLLPRAARLHHEAAITLQHGALYNEPELHFDFSTNPNNKSYQVYLAWRGINRGRFKPEAFMATAVADYFLEH